jgi:hypothetical protein
MPATPEPRRARLTLCAGLLLLCLAAHLSADMAWLDQYVSGAVVAAAPFPGTAAQAAADPHGEGALAQAPLAAACLALVWLRAILPPPALASLRPPLLHPPALLPR